MTASYPIVFFGSFASPGSNSTCVLYFQHFNLDLEVCCAESIKVLDDENQSMILITVAQNVISHKTTFALFRSPSTTTLRNWKTP